MMYGELEISNDEIWGNLALRNLVRALQRWYLREYQRLEPAGCRLAVGNIVMAWEARKLAGLLNVERCVHLLCTNGNDTGKRKISTR